MITYPLSYYYRRAAERFESSVELNGDHRGICGLLRSVTSDAATERKLLKLFSLWFRPIGKTRYDYWFDNPYKIHNPQVLEAYHQRITALLPYC